MAVFGTKLQCGDLAFHQDVPLAVGVTLGCLNVITFLCSSAIILLRFRHMKVNWAKIRAHLFLEVDKTVQETVERRRLGVWSNVLHSAFLTVPPVMAGCAILSFALFYPDPPMFIAMNVVFVLCFNSGCYMMLFPATSMKGPDGILVTTFLLLGGVPGFATTYWSYALALGSAMIVHSCISMTAINMRLYSSVNLIHLGWQLWIAVSVSSSPVSMVENIFVAVAASGWNLIICFASRAVLQMWAEDEVKALKATKGEEVVQSLLSIMCDAVVALGVDLCVRDPCPRLASLLLRPDLARTPRNGLKFDRYLMDADVQRFQEFIQHTDAEENAARCIHVHMLDSIGTRVPVQIFHARMLDIENNVNHVLGVVEDKDQEAFCPPRQLQQDSHGVAPPAYHGSAYDYAASWNLEVQSDSGSVASSQLSPTGQRPTKSRKPTVVVDGESPFRILEVSPAVGKLFNFISPSSQSTGTAIGGWLEDPQTFLEFLEQGVAAVKSHCESMCASFGPSYVRPVCSQEVQKRLMMLEVTITYRPDSNPDLVITFRSVKVVPQVRWSSSSRGSQSSQGIVAELQDGVPDESHVKQLSAIRSRPP